MQNFILIAFFLSIIERTIVFETIVKYGTVEADWNGMAIRHPTPTTSGVFDQEISAALFLPLNFHCMFECC